MKKVLLAITAFILCFMLCTPKVYAAKTLGDVKKALQDLKNEKAANSAAKQKTESEIAQENAKISNAHAAVEQAESDIASAKIKIDETNANIEKVKDESSKLLVFYQIMQGDNSFLEYVSSAGSVTDMLMRAEAVSQVLNYNKSKLSNLEDLILENEQLQVDLKKKQEDLNAAIVTYEESLASLKDDLTSLVEVTLDIDQQIKAQEELIKFYESAGCKDNDDVDVCIRMSGTANWMKPVERGYISSGFGYRSFLLNGRPYSDFHPAVDIAGNGGGTPVYAAANGYVAAVIPRASCGGNQIYLHVTVQGVKYTLTYAHLKDVYVKVGQNVTQQDVIGSVGGGGSTLLAYGGWDTCSTGYHLHFGVTKGFYLGACSDCYTNYSTYIGNSIVPPMMPAYGTWFYSRF